MPVSEIIAVEETDSRGKDSGSGKWQKMEKACAFTGDAAAAVPSPARRRSAVSFPPPCSSSVFC